MAGALATRRPGAIIGSAAFAALLGLLWAFGPGADPARPFGPALVVTARVAAAYFLLAFSASALARLTPSARVLVANRRYLGLAFALVHGVHGLLVVAWAQTPEAELDPATLIGGGLAYGLAALMALTSNDASQRRLGAWWKRLHTVGAYWIWFVFALTFSGRAFEPSLSQALLVLLIAALMLRVAVALRRARQVAA
ncbi:MAG: hypothetical protein VX766_02000 [Pseudomonadota bacterium]|nr:hypothetical protein [Pseudomonadota bacterium]